MAARKRCQLGETQRQNKMVKFAVKKIGIIERYQEFLPVTDATPIISLNEGNTPLILAEALPQELGLKNVRIYYKFEGLNPTSFHRF